MAHSLAGVAKLCQVQPLRDVHPLRPSLLRVSAPRLEQVEPSPQDEVPVTRARYTAGAFAPPATRVAPSDKSRITGPVRGVQHSPQLSSSDIPFQRTVPMTDKQLEAFSSSVLSSSSSVWSAEERNQPASTSKVDVEELLRRENKSMHDILVIMGTLCSRGDFDSFFRFLQDCDKSLLKTIYSRFHHSVFFDAVAQSQKAKPAIQFAKLLAPYAPKPEMFLTRVLQVCAKCRDLEAGVAIVEWARKNGMKIDSKMLTTLIKVCKSVGNVDRAFRLYQEMRVANFKIDSHVFGVLIATHAEAMKRDLTVVHERKDQYVLLERAFQLVEDADRCGVHLEAPAWNSLIMCAGRSGEINRAFHAMSMMQRRGIEATAATYGSLIESCVGAGNAEQALRVFEVAVQKGFVSEVKLYTQALSACMRSPSLSWERALDIYSSMQRAAVRPDKKFFACLIAVAGRCGRLDTAFELLSEMAAEGISPSATSMSAIIHACLDRGNLALARRVYDMCGRQGVYPVVSQFNHLMDVYASERRFGEVVSLLGDMVAAGRQPNLNTYRILINACSFTDQGGLAFQVFALMHANKVKILQESFAQTIYYMLVKACFNQTRFLWVLGGYPPAPPEAPAAAGAGAANGAASGHDSAASGDSPAAAGAFTNHINGGSGAPQAHRQASPPQLHPHPPHHGLPPPERRMEAEKLLTALGSHKLRRGAHLSDPFAGPPDTIDWASHALSAFHHMLNRGFRPTLELLDTLLNCMRAKMLPLEDQAPLDTPAGLVGSRLPGAGSPMAPLVPRRSRNEVFEVAFEHRAFVILEEAITRGLLPRYDLDAPLVVDFRRVPPVVAEVYVLHMLSTLERRAVEKKAKAAKAAAAAMAAGGTSVSGSMLLAASGHPSYHHPITLLVPPFDPDLVKWPSYMERLINRYTAMMNSEDLDVLHQRYRHRARASRRQSRGHASVNGAADDASAPGGIRQLKPRAAVNGLVDASAADGADLNGNGANGHASSHQVPEHDLVGAVEDRFVDGQLRDPWADQELYNWTSDYDEDEEASLDPAGGRYLADHTTGLAVAATLQRMKVWMDMDYQHGAITVSPLEVTRFLKRRRQAAEVAASLAEERAVEAAKGGVATGPGSHAPAPGAGARAVAAAGAAGLMAASVAGGVPNGRLGVMVGRGGAGSLVEQQQRNIRLGMMGGPTGRGSQEAAAGPGSAVPHHQNRPVTPGRTTAGDGVSGGSRHGGAYGAPPAAGSVAGMGPRNQPAPMPLSPRGGQFRPTSSLDDTAGADHAGDAQPRRRPQHEGAPVRPRSPAPGVGGHGRAGAGHGPDDRQPHAGNGASGRNGATAFGSTAQMPLQQPLAYREQLTLRREGPGPSHEATAAGSEMRHTGLLPPGVEVAMGPGPAVTLSVTSNLSEAPVGATNT